MFDTFTGKCPHCGYQDFESQTKLGDNLLQTWKPGDATTIELDSEGPLRLRLKSACSECGNTVVAVLEDGVFTRFTKDEEHDIAEMPWGWTRTAMLT